MRTGFYHVAAVLLGLAAPGWGGLVFEREVVEEAAAPSEETHEAVFRFKNEGPGVVTILEVQSTCGCLGASTDKQRYEPGESGDVAATIKLGTFEGEVTKSIYVISDDPKTPKQMLQMKITIPRLMEIAPEVTSWSVGEDPKPKIVRINVLRDEPIEVTGVSTGRENFLLELKEVEKGRVYEVVVTPKTTSEPVLGAVKIETDCELTRYRSRLIFVNVVRPRRPGGSSPSGAAVTPPVQAPGVTVLPGAK